MLIATGRSGQPPFLIRRRREAGIVVDECIARMLEGELIEATELGRALGKAGVTHDQFYRRLRAETHACNRSSESIAGEVV